MLCPTDRKALFDTVMAPQIKTTKTTINKLRYQLKFGAVLNSNISNSVKSIPK